ncbi:Uncharacterised protein [Mycobacteroides abscessus subsp. abscessus]|nr:Uncharacterised protein [Mycobacteroides abscessus subsp. abscessus]
MRASSCHRPCRAAYWRTRPARTTAPSGSMIHSPAPATAQSSGSASVSW